VQQQKYGVIAILSADADPLLHAANWREDFLVDAPREIDSRRRVDVMVTIQAIRNASGQRHDCHGSDCLQHTHHGSPDATSHADVEQIRESPDDGCG
jgi:hypothetical protein